MDYYDYLENCLKNEFIKQELKRRTYKRKARRITCFKRRNNKICKKQGEKNEL